MMLRHYVQVLMMLKENKLVGAERHVATKIKARAKANV